MRIGFGAKRLYFCAKRKCPDSEDHGHITLQSKERLVVPGGLGGGNGRQMRALQLENAVACSSLFSLFAGSRSRGSCGRLYQSKNILRRIHAGTIRSLGSHFWYLRLREAIFVIVFRVWCTVSRIGKEGRRRRDEPPQVYAALRWNWHGKSPSHSHCCGFVMATARVSLASRRLPGRPTAISVALAIRFGGVSLSGPSRSDSPRTARSGE